LKSLNGVIFDSIYCAACGNELNTDIFNIKKNLILNFPGSEVFKMLLTQICIPGFHAATKPAYYGVNKSPVTSVRKPAEQTSLV